MKFSWGSTSSLTYKQVITWKRLTWNTIQPPPSVSRSQYTWKSWQLCHNVDQSHLPGSLGKVRWVNEVDTRFCGALSCLDVVARCTNMVSPCEVISLSCLLSRWCVQGMLRASRIATVEISKESVRSVGLKGKPPLNLFLMESVEIWNCTWRAVLLLLTLNSSLSTVLTADLSW